MNLSYYQSSPLEEWITQHYIKSNITFPGDLEVERVADIFQVDVVFANVKSHVQWDDDYYLIILNNRLSKPYYRADFFHELCHPLKHYGNQTQMPKAFRELQEIQAKLFQLYAALPFHIIKNYIMMPATVIADEFCLPVEIVETRLIQIRNRIFQKRIEKQYKSLDHPRKYDPAKWSNETKRIMQKLYLRFSQK